MTVTVLTGDCRDLMRDLRVDVVITDPPYGKTSHKWDTWPDGWPKLALEAAPHMWCFGIQSMLLERASEFSGWQYAEEIVWEKHNGSGPPAAAGRFLQVHELVLHWYQPPWSQAYADAPRLPSAQKRLSPIRRNSQDAPQRGGYSRQQTTWEDDGTRLARSVQRFPSAHATGNHETQKPAGLLDILVRASCPPGGTVLDPFAGSGATLAAAAAAGRNAIGIEIDPDRAEVLRSNPWAAWAPRPSAEVRRARTDLQQLYGFAEGEQEEILAGGAE